MKKKIEKKEYKTKYLKQIVSGIDIKPASGIYNTLENLSNLSFQGRNLGIAVKIWSKMLENKTTIFLGLAGALVPAGFRKILVYLIKNRLVDCIVSTGANLFHDTHEILGYYHWLGSPYVDDDELYKDGIDRIYDTFAVEAEFRETERFIAEFGAELDENYPYGTREFLNLLGRKLKKYAKNNGILTQAAESNIPIFCPAIADSSLGIALRDTQVKLGKNIRIDVIKDVHESGELIRLSSATSVIYLGGGTPKNFIQQATLVPAKSLNESFGHKYAIQITADAPHWGGLSGCTLEEAKSWGKICTGANQVTIHSDTTIAFPLLVTAIAQKFSGTKIKGRKKPAFNWSDGKLKIKYE